MTIFPVLVFLMIFGVGVLSIAALVFAILKRKGFLIALTLPLSLLIVFYFLDVAFGPLWQNAPSKIYAYAFKTPAPAGISFSKGYLEEGFFPGCDIYLEFVCDEKQLKTILDAGKFTVGLREQVESSLGAQNRPDWWLPATFTGDQTFIAFDFPGPYTFHAALLVRNSTNGLTYFATTGFD